MPSADMGVAEDIVSRVAEEIGAAGVTHDSEHRQGVASSAPA